MRNATIPITVIIPSIPERAEFLNGYCLPSVRKNRPMRTLVYEQVDLHPSKKRNLGAETAYSEFIFFCDDDTILHGDCFRLLFDAIQAKKADVAYCDFYRVPFPGSNRKCDLHKAGPVNNLEDLKDMNRVSMISLVRSSAFPGLDESLKMWHDWDLWLTMLANGCKFTYVPQPLFIACYLGKSQVSQPNTDLGKESTRIVQLKHNLI